MAAKVVAEVTGKVTVEVSGRARAVVTAKIAAEARAWRRRPRRWAEGRPDEG